MNRKMNRSPKREAGRSQETEALPVVDGSESGVPSLVLRGDKSARPDPRRMWAGVAALLLAVALGVALFLAWQSMAGSAIPGCGPQSGCSDLLGGRWGGVGGVPVSLFGAAVYVVLLVSALRGAPGTRWQFRLERGMSILVLASALWFTIVQAVFVGKFCPWCTATHAVAVAGTILLWRSRQTVAPGGRGKPSFVEFALPLAALAGVALFQVMAPKVERIQQRTLGGSVASEAGKLSLHQGRVVLVPEELPVIGLPQAAVSAVALTDFTCPHCRELHRSLAQLAEQRPGQFQAVLLPAAYDPEARELHRVMLALWRLDPGLYRKLADELVGGTMNPAAKDVLDSAQKSLGGRFYELAWPHAGWVQDTLRLGEELQALNEKEGGATTLPQTLLLDRILTGAPNVETLAGILDSAPSPAAAAVASAAAPQPSVPSATGAVIAFESTTVDLGTVTRGDPLTRKVTFANTGSAPLTLSKIKASCGCTTVKGWEQTVAPGQQGSFELNLDTTKFTGPVTKTVDVESNATNGMTRLTLKAEVWSPVRIFPPMVAFGTLLKGSKVEPRLIEITVTEPENTKISGLTCSNPYFHTELRTLEEGRRYQIAVTVPELGERAQTGELTLGVGHPKLKEMKIPVHVSPVDPLVVQPKQLNLSAASLKTAPSKSITVFCHDRAVASLEITDLTFSGGTDVKLAFEPQGDKRWGRVSITFPDGFAPSQDQELSVSFRTNHPDFPLVTVPIRFFGTAAIARKSPAAITTQ